MEKDELIKEIQALQPGFNRLFKEYRMDEPDWEPLEKVLPMEWCDGFGFMGYVGDIRMYKHGITRRYLNVDPKGKVYRYDSDKDEYFITSLDLAVDNVFDGIKEMGWTRETKVDDEFMAARRRALEEAGWTILQVGPTEN
jgi:hypothetical protein